MTILPDPNLKNTPVTFLRDINKPLIFSEIPVEEVLVDIKGPKYKEQIHHLQTLDDKAYALQKKSLPAVSFHGTYKNAVLNKNFQQSSGLFCFDVDKLPPDILDSVKIQVANIGCVVFCFVSPSGKGLKGAIRILPESMTNDADCKRNFKQVQAFFADKGITIDPACKDIRRLSFLSHDPKIYINWDAEAFPVQVECSAPVQVQTFRPPTQQPTSDDDEARCIAICVGIIAKSVPGRRHGARLEAGKTAGGYVAAGRVSEDVILDALMAASDKVAEAGITDPGEAKTIRDAITHGMEAPLFAEVVPETDTIKRLAELSPIEYERARSTEAAAMGVRVGALDRLIEAEQKRSRPAEDVDNSGLVTDVEPWPEAVDLSGLLGELVEVIKRFIVCGDETAIAATLWVVLTWFIDEIDIAPLANINAPEMRSGKSQLLFLLGQLARRALSASNITPAALFRVVEMCGPTLFIDEADAFLKENEELRGILNSGHTRGSAFVIRTVGDDHTPAKFSTWGMKAIAGIGHIHGTLADRSIMLRLRRKLPHESVDRLRHVEPDLFPRLAAQLARVAVDYQGRIRESRPQAPPRLDDRSQDNWSGLLSIADLAGGEWPRLARLAAVGLSAASESDSVSVGVELLGDLQPIFAIHPRIHTAELLATLCADEEQLWAAYNRGRPMSARQLSNRLAEYGIRPHTITVRGQTRKGYEADQFKDAFRRYIPITSSPFLASLPLVGAPAVG